jgi:hypothetical protein
MADTPEVPGKSVKLHHWSYDGIWFVCADCGSRVASMLNAGYHCYGRLMTEEPVFDNLDPTGLDAHEPGAKLDAGKPDASLLLMFGEALKAVADVGTFGAKKYSRGGWQKVEDGENRYTAALLRHLMSENLDPNDPETGKLHAAHAAWNALARLELMLRKAK